MQGQRRDDADGSLFAIAAIAAIAVIAAVAAIAPSLLPRDPSVSSSSLAVTVRGGYGATQGTFLLPPKVK
eukprot:4445166-Prymnesium_polylepis.1